MRPNRIRIVHAQRRRPSTNVRCAIANVRVGDRLQLTMDKAEKQRAFEGGTDLDEKEEEGGKKRAERRSANANEHLNSAAVQL